jgi:quinol monooxygenase YgiN
MPEKKCIVTATFTPKPEHFESVRQLLLNVIPEVHQEEGCDFYTLNESVTGELIFIEAWDSRALWIKHNGQSTVARVNEGVEGKLLKPVDVKEMYSLPAGDAFKGVL